MSVNSVTDICNLALDLLSAGTVQNVEQPTSPTEELLNRWYDLCRQKALRAHPWNFATKRAILAASATDPLFGYAKAFPVPADFLRLLYVTTDLILDEETVMPTNQYQFEGGSILITNTYSDTTSLNIVYIYNLTEVSQMDSLFIDLLVYEIALSVAYKVTETNTNIQRIGELMKERKALAKAIDGQERPPIRIQRSEALAARRNNSTRHANRVIF